MKKGKRYAELAKLVDRSTLYDPSEAAKLVCETGKAKFDETVELHVRLGVDSRHADQQVRGAVVLPHGTGRTKTVLVLAKGPKADEAKAAGAEFVGDDDMIAKIEKENWFDFDVIIATPDMMGKLGKLGKVLGPKGLMPNPLQRLLTKLRPVRSSTDSTSPTSFTAPSARFLSDLRSSKRTSRLSWKLSSRLSRQQLRVSTSRIAQSQQRWALVSR